MSLTPLSLAVPLDGTDHELGIRQLQKYISSSPSIRSQYRRFHGPFLEDLTLEDITQRKQKGWQDFLPVPQNPKTHRSDVYTVPGSIVALCERVEENLNTFLMNYVQVAVCSVYVMLGAGRGLLCTALGASYIWLRDPDYPWPPSWKLIRIAAVQFVYPFLVVILTLLTSLGAQIITGMLLGVMLMLLHAGCRRSPSEMRYLKQMGIIRWLRRRRAPKEGTCLLWTDIKSHLQDWKTEVATWLQWKMLHARDVLGLLRLTLIQKMKRRVNKKTISLVG